MTIELAFVLSILAVDLVLLVGVTVIINKLNYIIRTFGKAIHGAKRGQ